MLGASLFQNIDLSLINTNPISSVIKAKYVGLYELHCVNHVISLVRILMPRLYCILVLNLADFNYNNNNNDNLLSLLLLLFIYLFLNYYYYYYYYYYNYYCYYTSRPFS